MKRILALTLISALALPAIDAQTYFSVDAGTDGFNFNVTNVPPLYPVVVAPAPAPVCVPFPRGVVYHPEVSPKQYKKAAKRYKKAVKRYRKAMRRSSPDVGFYFPGGIVIDDRARYYFDDDDDYEDWLEDQLEEQYEHNKKLYKHYKKHNKHYKKHNKHSKHHDDD